VRVQQQSESTTKTRGIYLLPNLFTISALFAGFYAIVAAMRGNFANAAIAIFIGMLLDSLDGRIARLTQTTTAFGAELDSLSDMVSFGVAPALVIYTWSLLYIGKVGWLVAFIYAAAVALRLARFNTHINTTDKKYFTGLACTPGAGIIAGWVWVGSTYGIPGLVVSWTSLIITLLVALLMISSIRYHSFKDLDFKGRVPFLTIFLLVMVIVLISYAPPQMLFLTFALYGLSGPILTVWVLRKKRSLLLRKAKKSIRSSKTKSPKF
jgi:CDP-diacylglycerol--serine O-phosphatidyltransferase